MKMHAALASLALLASVTSFAQAPPPGGPPSPEMQAARENVTHSCAADVKALCQGKEGHESMVCLRAAAPEKVSAPCKDAMAKLVRAPR
jgi:hypothetical protein